MTVEQALEYIHALQEKCIHDFKDQAILLNGLALQTASAVACKFDKKSKYLGLDKLYPNYFGRKSSLYDPNMDIKEKQKLIIETWRTFLGA